MRDFYDWDIELKRTLNVSSNLNFSQLAAPAKRIKRNEHFLLTEVGEVKQLPVGGKCVAGFD